jgi:hypothetical protein
MRVHAENVLVHDDIVHIESTYIVVNHCRNHNGDRRNHRHFGSDVVFDVPLNPSNNNDRRHGGNRNVRPRHLRRN